LVADLVRWLAGRPTESGLDPEVRAEEVARRFSQSGLHEEAQQTRGGVEHLDTVRRAYDALATAQGLNFVYLSRLSCEQELPTVRLNLVLNGALAMAESLSPHTSHQQIVKAMELAEEGMLSAREDGHRPLVAVPQSDLDCLLAVGRWVQQDSHGADVLVHIPDSRRETLERARVQITAGCQPLFAR
jgi:hypothetical protein